MYFENRNSAGNLLAEQLFEKYRFEDCAVIALNEGGVLVGEPIAAALHSVLNLLLSEEVELAGENLILGSVSQNGNFVRNSFMTNAEFEGYVAESFGAFQKDQFEKFQKINRLIGDGGTISLDLLRNRNIILVSDGFAEKATLDVVLDFLKPIDYKKLIVAAPVASVEAIDRLHISADELHILDVKANYFGANHYYDENELPSREEVVKKINEIILNWR
ncbi:MAG: phosphoribosyltransferase family protein [bacterium]|nr:phosphoribosyltransferase family protein [bacterium]